jgi:hypothetical protein
VDGDEVPARFAEKILWVLGPIAEQHQELRVPPLVGIAHHALDREIGATPAVELVAQRLEWGDQHVQSLRLA